MSDLIILECVERNYRSYLGLIAFFYAIRSLHAHRQGFYAEATVFYKKSIQWSLITFVLGLVIGSIVTLILFVRGVVSV